jgi:hypothetical protein
VIDPSLWQREIEKYTKWLTEAAPPKDNALRDALAGLDRASPRFESDNSANIAPGKPFDSLPAFTTLWNQAFNPPPPGAIDWDGIVARAWGGKFSVARFSSPMNYVYEVSVLSRKTWHRVSFTLYSESSVLVPLPPAEYTVIVRSLIEQQKGQRWTSEYTAFSLSVTDEPSLIAMDFKTRVARR